MMLHGDSRPGGGRQDRRGPAWVLALLRRWAGRAWWWAADYAYVAVSWVVAIRQRHDRWPAPAPGADKASVLLLPGIYESWRFLQPIALRLLETGHRVHVVPLGLNRAGLRPTAARVRAYLRRHTREQPVVLVAHSKGGLIGKQLMLDLARLPAPHVRTSCAVHGMVTINTPFAGSAYAPFLPLTELRALGPRALRALAAEVSTDARVVAIRASWDPHIPGARDLPGATNLVVPALGHFRIVADPHTQDLVVRAASDLAALEPLRG